MNKSAIFSECGFHRYALIRSWSDKPKAMCIGLNPSTANQEEDDPTIRRLITILTNNGFGGFYMLNLFSLVSPYPRDLRSCPDPIKDNDIHLNHYASISDSIIFCWGNFKQAEYRAKLISKLFPNAFCFGQNANGSPKHPLYLKSETKIVKYF